jgi:hypothetical protein
MTTSKGTSTTTAGKTIMHLLRSILKPTYDSQYHLNGADARLQFESGIWEELNFTTKHPENVRRFRSLSEAIDFIAVCLETDTTTGLSAEIEGLEALLSGDRGYAYYFVRDIFTPLKEIHEKKDLRNLYRDREFPTDEHGFKLGGHFSELGNIHISFMHRDGGWVIHDVWLTRQAPNGRLVILAGEQSED